MENIKAIFENSNFLIFLIVLVAIMGLFVLVGNVIKTFREIKKPRDDERDNIKIEVKELRHKIDKIETVIDRHGEEIDDIRHTNRIQCQAVRALLNHAIHDGNSDEMQRAANELDRLLESRI